MEVRSGSIFFPKSRGSGPRTANSSPLVFPRQVLRATAGLTGYTAQFLPDDHHLGQVRVQVTPTVIGNTVSVAATFGLRDWSGDWDDDYAGTVNFVVLADLESATAPPPRPDLQIVDAEVSQVIQFFRSATHLDPTNARPDNSIPLMERKPTGVRLYVDYDASLGLSPITNLSGEIEVQSPAGTRVLSPVAGIVPKREFLIQRGVASDTLNFVIPEELCIGVVTLRARVFSATAPTSKSALFEKSIRFVDVPSVRVYLVGVNYTGQGLNLAAPTQAQLTSSMNLTERLYPTGEVQITGYQVLPFNVDMKANISGGCGDGFGSLLDRLEDLRGNSSDIYYGELPGVVDTGSVGGCGRSGVASSVNAAPGIAAHEVAHAFGLPHSPCDTTSCPTQPANADSNYPYYGNYPRGSIGEFGYDPLFNSVFDPATTFDFMSYAGPTWMSPYNYARLMLAGGGPSDASSAAAAAPGAAMTALSTVRGPLLSSEYYPVQMEYLHLRLTIQRDRKVDREHSFHFPAMRGSSCGHATDYVAEILDGDGKTLVCVPLSCSCNLCQPKCYPVLVRNRVPMPPNARTLRVWEGRDKMIYEEAIPDPPQVQWKSKTKSPDGMTLKWEGKGGAGQELRYLVQFEDRPGVWRGLMPRNADPKIVVPWDLFKRRSQLHVRVLASSGIATAVVDDWIATEKPGDGTPPTPPQDQPPVVVSPYGALEVGKEVGAYLRAIPEAGALVRWYDDAGAELSGSGTLDVRNLPDGSVHVRAVSTGGSGLHVAVSLLLEKEGGSVRFVRDFGAPEPEPDPTHSHPHPTIESKNNPREKKS